ncbi:MAG: macro domain-containing protein [Erysipelotrichaceae bacterium]|nr:macro domain-containing protein [Erysipelotrichaceae bacterium]
MNTLEIRKVSITESGCEAVVNAANEQLLEGGGVCGYIFSAAGSEKLRQVCERIGFCQTGDAVITEGFDLCPYIIHAVGPIYINGRQGEEGMLYECYRRSLTLARQYGIASIAFPLISAGIYGYPKKEAWKVALRSCDDWMKKNPDGDMKIVFAVIDDQILELGKQTAERMGIKA